MAGILPLRRLMRPRGSTLQFKPRAVHSCGMDLCSSLAKLRHSDPRCHARHSSQSHHRRLHHILDVFSGHLVDVLHRRPAAIGVVQGKVRRSSTSSDTARGTNQPHAGQSPTCPRDRADERHVHRPASAPRPHSPAPDSAGRSRTWLAGLHSPGQWLSIRATSYASTLNTCFVLQRILFLILCMVNMT